MASLARIAILDDAGFAGMSTGHNRASIAVANAIVHVAYTSCKRRPAVSFRKKSETTTEIAVKTTAYHSPE